jgi:hypothetical protein
MFGYTKVPPYARTRLQDRPDGATLRAIVESHLQALEGQIGDPTEGEFVISVHPAPTGQMGDKAWDVLTSWGEPA